MSEALVCDICQEMIRWHAGSFPAMEVAQKDLGAGRYGPPDAKLPPVTHHWCYDCRNKVYRFIKQLKAEAQGESNT